MRMDLSIARGYKAPSAERHTKLEGARNRDFLPPDGRGRRRFLRRRGDTFRGRETVIGRRDGTRSSAALITTLIKSEYEKYKLHIRNPGELLEQLNASYIGNYQYLSYFFTCIVLDLDLDKKTLTYASGRSSVQYLIRAANWSSWRRPARSWVFSRTRSSGRGKCRLKRATSSSCSRTGFSSS